MQSSTEVAAAAALPANTRSHGLGTCTSITKTMKKKEEKRIRISQITQAYSFLLIRIRTCLPMTASVVIVQWS